VGTLVEEHGKFIKDESIFLLNERINTIAQSMVRVESKIDIFNSTLALQCKNHSERILKIENERENERENIIKTEKRINEELERRDRKINICLTIFAITIPSATAFVVWLIDSITVV